jgi:hypothetical protein
MLVGIVLIKGAYDRRALRHKIAILKEHKLAALEKEILEEGNRLFIDLSKWRHDQLFHMVQVTDLVGNQANEEPEVQILYLPSDFPNDGSRERLKINKLGQVELELRKGEAYDAVEEVRTAVKHINGLTYKKQSSVRQSGPNTRTKEMIDDIKRRRDASIEKYTFSRNALMNLGFAQTGPNDDFPELTVDDAVMKYAERPHALGDGSKGMAAIWRAAKRAPSLPQGESVIGMSFALAHNTTPYFNRLQSCKRSYSSKS